MTDKNDNIATLAQKIMQFAVDFEGVTKTRKNKHTNANYANFDDIWLAARKPLNDAGLTCLFRIDAQDGVQTLTLIVADGTEQIASSLPINPEKNTAQALGSFLTYAKRYLITTVLNITEAMGDVDDDGHEASAPATLTSEQQTELYAHASELFGDDAAKTIKAMAKNVFDQNDFKNIPSANFAQAIKLLDKKADQIAKDSEAE